MSNHFNRLCKLQQIKEAIEFIDRDKEKSSSFQRRSHKYLEIACKYGSLKLLSYIIDICEEPIDYIKLLRIAIINMYEDIINYLSLKRNIFTKDEEGNPLIFYIFNNRPDECYNLLVKIIENCTDEMINETNAFGVNVLTVAIEEKHLKCAEYLIKKKVNIRNKEIDIIVENGYYNLLKLIMEYIYLNSHTISSSLRIVQCNCRFYIDTLYTIKKLNERYIVPKKTITDLFDKIDNYVNISSLLNSGISTFLDDVLENQLKELKELVNEDIDIISFEGSKLIKIEKYCNDVYVSKNKISVHQYISSFNDTLNDKNVLMTRSDSNSDDTNMSYSTYISYYDKYPNYNVSNYIKLFYSNGIIKKNNEVSLNNEYSSVLILKKVDLNYSYYVHISDYINEFVVPINEEIIEYCAYLYYNEYHYWIRTNKYYYIITENNIYIYDISDVDSYYVVVNGVLTIDPYIYHYNKIM